MNKKLRYLIPVFIAIIAFSACSPVTETPVPDEFILAADLSRQRLADDLGIAPGQIEIVGVEAFDWPDACLGLPDDGEICAQVLTPGYRVTLEAADQIYVFRTNELGTIIRSGDTLEN